MTSQQKYSPGVRRYSPMENQSNGERPKPYIAYNSNTPKYSVTNFTVPPPIVKRFNHKTVDSERILAANTRKTVECKPSILQRLYSSLLNTQKTVKQAIRDFFRRKK